MKDSEKENQINKGLRTSPKANKVGYTWCVKFTNLSNNAKKHLPEELLIGCTKSIAISNLCSKHSNGCVPGNDQYVFAKTRAGDSKATSLILHC